MKKFDIVIIGSGTVGLTLACLLAKHEISIALIDAQPAPDTDIHTTYDTKVSAINHASQRIFSKIGVWAAMQQYRVSPYHHMKIWDIGSPACIEFHREEIHQACLGYIIEHRILRQTLWQPLNTCENIQLYPKNTPQKLQEKKEHVEITLADGQILATNLLVGADGQYSWVRHQTKMGAGNHDFHTTSSSQESAVVATLHSEYPHQETCFQRFLEKGPVALLPLADPHLVSLVWSTSTSEANRLMSISADSFNDELGRALEKVLGHLTLCSDRIVFPLLRHQARHYVKSHIALIGDAAHSILPLAGQGLNAGLLDAACLAQVILWAQNKHRPIDSIDTLRRYELWRKGENTAMRWAMEGFYSGFSSRNELVRHLRYVGFLGVQKLSRVKKYFIQRAAGLKGDLPDIAQ